MTMRLEPESYPDIRENLRLRVMDIRSSGDELENAVWQDAGCGYALVAYLELPENLAGGGVVNIPKDFAEACGLDTDQIFADAMESAGAMSGPRLTPLEAMLFGGQQENLLEGGTLSKDTKLLVLTTENGILGASALFYPEMMEKVAEAVGGSYYVLPSSVHEVLIMPEGGEMSPMEMANMVREINEAEVSPKERLGNRVLHYRGDLQQLRVAADMDREAPGREER